MAYIGAGVGVVAVVGGGELRLFGLCHLFEMGYALGYGLPLGLGLLGELFLYGVALGIVMQQVEVLQRGHGVEKVGRHNERQGMGYDIVLYCHIVTEGVGDRHAVLHLIDGDASVGRLVKHVGKHQHPVVEETRLEEGYFARLRQQTGGEQRVLLYAITEAAADVDAASEGVLDPPLEVTALTETGQRGGRVMRQLGAVDVEPEGPFALEAADVFALAKEVGHGGGNLSD